MIIIVFIAAKNLTLLVFPFGRMDERDDEILQGLEQDLRWGVCGWIYIVHGTHV
jgi:hypothetical protein